MKSYLKSLTQSLYQKVQRVVQDEYIQPMTESQIYAIINRKRPHSSLVHNKHAKSPFNRQSSSTQQILDNIERLALITPERQFKLIGDTYSVEVVSYRMKELKIKIQAVKHHMIQNYPKHLEAIQTALLQIQTINNLVSTRQKSLLLKNKLQNLHNLVTKTIKITTLNIKLKNIKQTLKISQQIPNIKNMHLFELKNINLTQINQFKSSLKTLYPSSQQKELHCIQHLQQFIDKVSSENLRVLIGDITSCISEDFVSQKYDKAIRDFIISRSEIEYQKLVIRLLEGQIRDKIEEESGKSQERSALVFRCKKYIKMLINLSKIFRWHRYNLAVSDVSPEIEQKMRARNNSVTSNCSEQSQQKQPAINIDSEASIRVHTEEVKRQACELMDQCLKEEVEGVLLNEGVKNEDIFEMLVLLNSFYRIAFAFSSFLFSQSTQTIKQLLLRKCYKQQQRGINQLNQSLLKQQQSEWNRLPLFKNYRFKSLERTLERIKKLHLYEKIPSLALVKYKFLNLQEGASPEDCMQMLSVHEEVCFQLQQVGLPYQKTQKTLSYQLNQSPLPEHEDPQVVVCRSSLIILSQFEQLVSMYFYYPIQEIRNAILNKVWFYLDYYVYFLFQAFLSQMYKKLFFQHNQAIQQAYLQVRVKSLYREVYRFIVAFEKGWKGGHSFGSEMQGMNGDSNFSNGKNNKSMEINKYKSRGYSFIMGDIKPSKVSPQNSIKSRAIATDSIKFLLAYLSNIFTHLEKYTLPKNNQTNQPFQFNSLQTHISKLQTYKLLYSQLSDLLLTDITPTSTKIDFVQPIMKKIKWHQVENAKEIAEYGAVILKSVKETYDRMKAMSKGEIPYYLVDKVFSFYWKTQLTFITKIFLEDHVATKQKGGKNAKLAFQKLIDSLYEGLIQSIQTKPKSSKQLSSLTNSSKSLYAQYISHRVQKLKLSYLKIKNIFPMLLQNNWQQCQKMVFESLKNFQFIYKIQVTIMKASESSSGLSQAQVEERVQEIDYFIRSQIAGQ